MTRSEFQELLKIGLGRAIVYARDHDCEPFREIILDACLHCYSFDVQCEGTRADFMHRLLKLLPDGQYYRDAVLATLRDGGDDDDAAQHFFFVMNMAFEGDTKARSALYETFTPGPNKGPAMAISFVDLDGLSGFRFAAAKIGELLMSATSPVEVDWLWTQTMEICGEQEARSALSEAATSDSRMAAFAAAVAAAEARSVRSDEGWMAIKNLEYVQLKPRMPSARRYHLNRWGREASDLELSNAAQGLADAQNDDEQLQHLRIFEDRPYPLDPRLLAELASSPSEDLTYAASLAASQITHPVVRDLAFRLVQDRLVGRKFAVGMLALNWAPNDHDVVLTWFEDECDQEARHGMEIDIRGFWERHPNPASELRMLNLLYEKGPCSECRESVVHRLIELDTLSEVLRAECAHDANDEVRKLVGATDATA